MTNEDYKKLRLKWYKKLEQTGFVDIERTGSRRDEIYNETGSYIKHGDSYIRSKYKSTSFTYYQSWRNFSNYAELCQLFNPIERKIIHLHGEGITYRKMSKLLMRSFPPSIHGHTTSKLIKQNFKEITSYSIFFICKRLKTLAELKKLWHDGDSLEQYRTI
jgi:hypothetical protein